MGNPKQKWTAEEEEALRAGVAKHGTGKWKNIQRDPEFNPYLFSRSNIDLKDKWRNMSVSAGEKSRTPKPKAAANSESPAPLAAVAAITPRVSTPLNVDSVGDDDLKIDAKSAPKYNAMIFEAISASGANGADTSAILSYIEQRQELPQNFRRQLQARLRRLVQQQKLEKVQNCYQLKKDSPIEMTTPSPKPKEVLPKPPSSTALVNATDTSEDAADAAAYRVAEAENKSFVAAEAVKEADRVSKMAEDTELFLQLAKEIFDKCSQGEIVLMA